MANTRIKDISTAATTLNSDDFIAVDGNTAGTRKMAKADLITEVSTGVSGTYLEESNNLSDVASKDTSKLNLEVPDVGSSPDEVSLNGMLGSMAFQSSEGISVARAEVESTTGTATTQALTVTDGSSTNFVVQEDGSVSVGATNGAIAAADDDAGLVLQQSVGGVAELSRATDTDGHVVGKVNFANRNNSNTVNPGSANYPAVAGIEAQLETTDSNAHDDSGGHLVFKTKPEAGLIAERLRLDSQGRLGVGTVSPPQRLTVQGGGVQIAGAISSPASGVSALLLDWVSSNSRYWSRGADATTQGTHNFYVLENDGGNQVNALEVNASGIKFPASGLGIDFGSTTTGTGTPTGGLLNDYEVGTWTPTLTSTGTAPSLNYSLQVGAYVKIGNLVTCHCRVRVNTITSAGTGDLELAGLPFSTKNTASLQNAGSIGHAFGFGTSVSGCPTHLTGNNNVTKLQFKTLKNSSGLVANLDPTSAVDLLASCAVDLCITYTTD